MSAEDRLRDLLRSEADTIVPAGDGLARIRERIARRRRARFWLLPSAAVATAAAAGAFFLLAPDDRRTATLTPAQTPSALPAPEPTASTSPVPVAPDDGGMPLTGAAIWPFTSQAQAASWTQDYPYAGDGLEVGRHFVADFLGLKDLEVVVPHCVSCDQLNVVQSGTTVGTITLTRFGTGFASGHGVHLYTVAGVGGLDLTITSPRAGDAITSPTSVTGRAGQPDENVQLRLLSQAGKELSTSGAPAGREIPWTGSLGWTDQQWSHGAVVGVTRSARDGAITRVVAVPVVHTTGATASGASFAGLVDGHVSLYDAATGKKLRQLTYPPQGKSDTAATWSQGTLAWVRTAGASACVNELDRLEGGTASKVASSTTARFGSPHLSDDGGRLGWVETPCRSGAPDLVLQARDGTTQRLRGPSGSTVDLLDVRDDGALLVLTNDLQPTGPGTIGLLAPGSRSLSALRPLAASSGCTLASGAAFLSGAPVAFESCGEQVRLVRFASGGSRGSTDKAFTGEPPTAVSATRGKLLVWLFGGDHVGPLATYRDGAFTTLVPNDGCASTTDLKGCVSAPDW
ncbi:MAG TPA: Gmad2 immunoglobulin-like domain-containing protein [Mycobacteriales bacterium]|nr:Gmad2 immunoglobulin-like domain-containing protein [Mycobacteriales bacterium]